jgi:chorismate synthase
MGSTWGKVLKISVFGESHGEAVGIVIDGFPAGIAADETFIHSEMRRRAPGGYLATPRKESDEIRIVSGVLKGITTGAPICAMIQNSNVRSADYLDLSDVPRPSHADFTGAHRYQGFNDPRGGGHFSGRLTAPLVFAGALCKLYLKSRGIATGAHLKSVGMIADDNFAAHHLTIDGFASLAAMELPFLSSEAGGKAREEILKRKAEGDSVGGVVECAVIGVKAGLGSPMFDAVESRIASLIFAIPGVKGVEFGEGFNIAKMLGSKANDRFCIKDDQIFPETNNNGGCLGGITTGSPIIFRAAFKPTPSIEKPQMTANVRTGTMEELVIKGRHDPCIAVRAVPVIEAAAAITLTDIALEAFGYERP